MAARQRLKIPPDASPNPDARREMRTDRRVAVAVGALTTAAEPSRLRSLWAVSDEELDVATLAALAGISVTAASQHLAKLRLAGLVVARRDGRRVLYTARGAHVRRLIAEALSGRPSGQWRAGPRLGPDLTRARCRSASAQSSHCEPSRESLRQASDAHAIRHITTTQDHGSRPRARRRLGGPGDR